MTEENSNHPNNGGQDDAVTGRIKILVVEDSPPMNLLYDRGLPDTIFEKRFAKDGQEGLIVYEEWRPDVIVLDVMLPVLTGYSVLKKIRNSFKDKSTTIIMSTSLSKEDDVKSMMKLGIQGYIVKPFNIREIGRRILKYYENIDPARAAAAIVLHDQFLEELTRAAMNMKPPVKKNEEDKDGANAGSDQTREENGDPSSVS